MTFAVERPDGSEVARGKDLDVLQERLAAPVRAAVAKAVAGELERTGLQQWPADLAELPRLVERRSGEHVVRGFPALVDRAGAVDIRVFPTPAEQAAAMGTGTRRLLRLSVPSPVKPIERGLGTRTRLVLGANPDGSLPALIEDCVDAAVDALVRAPAWTRADFETLAAHVRAELPGAAADVVAAVQRVLAVAHEVRLALPADPPAAQREAVEDVRAQFRRLLPEGFVARTGRAHLSDLERYLQAVRRRLDLLPRDVDTDRGRMLRVRAVTDAYDQLAAALPAGRAAADDVLDIARLIEELRVSLWAQQLGTPRPVSEQRIYRAIDAVAP